MDKAEAKEMLLMRAKRIVEHLEEDDLWSAVWGTNTLESHLMDKDVLAAYDKMLVYGDTILDRRLVDILDRKCITEFGKFEGETEATRYIWERIMDGDTTADFSHEGFGYYALFKREREDPLEFPCYLVHESNMTGFVKLISFYSVEEGQQAWDNLMHELGNDPDVDYDEQAARIL